VRGKSPHRVERNNGFKYLSHERVQARWNQRIHRAQDVLDPASERESLIPNRVPKRRRIIRRAKDQSIETASHGFHHGERGFLLRCEVAKYAKRCIAAAKRPEYSAHRHVRLRRELEKDQRPTHTIHRVQAVALVPNNAHLCFRLECILHALADVRIEGKDDDERDTSCVIHGTT